MQNSSLPPVRNDPPKVYLAGPILWAEEGGHGWRDRVIDAYPDAFEWVNPLDIFDGSEDEATLLPKDYVEYYDEDDDENVITDEELVEADKEEVFDCDGMLVGLMDTVHTWGTPQEQVLKWQQGRSNGVPGGPAPPPVVVWHNDLDELDLSPWMRYHSTFRSPDMHDCVDRLQAKLGTHRLCLDCMNDMGIEIDGMQFTSTDDACDNCKQSYAVLNYGGQR